jgi:autophagy-related protein 9
MSIYHDPGNGEISPTRRMSNSRSMLGSTTRSQPFLNMLNPIGGGGRRYAGYAQVLEENEENEDEGEHTERENIPLHQSSHRAHGETDPGASSSSPPARRVSWQGRTPVLSPNIHSADNHNNQDSSDDEVPQSFMIETNAARTPPRMKPKSRSKGKERERVHRLKTSEPPILPVGADVPPRVSIPPRPSEVNLEAFGAEDRPTPQPMRGLDAYERALWNWVNVYNLDAFLQEVYFYYEGKGIYCIALARGLNLL